jgi:hypothetical protein
MFYVLVISSIADTLLGGIYSTMIYPVIVKAVYYQVYSTAEILASICSVLFAVWFAVDNKYTNISSLFKLVCISYVYLILACIDINIYYLFFVPIKSVIGVIWLLVYARVLNINLTPEYRLKYDNILITGRQIAIPIGMCIGFALNSCAEYSLAFKMLCLWLLQDINVVLLFIMVSKNWIKEQ